MSAPSPPQPRSSAPRCRRSAGRSTARPPGIGGQLLGGGLKLGRGGGHTRDDAADSALEVVGQGARGGPPLRLGAGAGGLRLLFQGAGAEQVVLEHLHRRGHGADLVAAPPSRYGNRRVARRGAKQSVEGAVGSAASATASAWIAMAVTLLSALAAALFGWFGISRPITRMTGAMGC
jgi:hypothetical protein